MKRDHLQALLAGVSAGEVGVAEALAALSAPPIGDLPGVQLDLHRQQRTGHAEVVYGEGKDVGQISAILERLRSAGQPGLVTRVDPEKARAVIAALPDVRWHTRARVLELAGPAAERVGCIAVVCAGTSDLPVAEEAAVVAEAVGNRVERITDVGVAGIHRVLAHAPALSRANVIIVVAGMEGALASVVAGLVARPVIAVPTSVGYGAHFGGLAALLGMLNACAAGISVVNIDNGFGAAMQASLINRLAVGAP